MTFGKWHGELHRDRILLLLFKKRRRGIETVRFRRTLCKVATAHANVVGVEHLFDERRHPVDTIRGRIDRSGYTEPFHTPSIVRLVKHGGHGYLRNAGAKGLGNRPDPGVVDVETRLGKQPI